MALQTMRGVTVLMPRYLDYNNSRAPTFSRYLVLQDRVSSSEFFEFSDRSNGPYWVDPTTPKIEGAHLGLAFLSFTGEDGDLFPNA
jgi:hypothetical protein